MNIHPYRINAGKKGAGSNPLERGGEGERRQGCTPEEGGEETTNYKTGLSAGTPRGFIIRGGWGRPSPRKKAWPTTRANFDKKILKTASFE